MRDLAVSEKHFLRKASFPELLSAYAEEVTKRAPTENKAGSWERALRKQLMGKYESLSEVYNTSGLRLQHHEAALTNLSTRMTRDNSMSREDFNEITQHLPQYFAARKDTPSASQS